MGQSVTQVVISKSYELRAEIIAKCAEQSAGCKVSYKPSQARKNYADWFELCVDGTLADHFGEPDSLKTASPPSDLFQRRQRLRRLPRLPPPRRRLLWLQSLRGRTKT